MPVEALRMTDEALFLNREAVQLLRRRCAIEQEAFISLREGFLFEGETIALREGPFA
jgi:hypothetical protein